MTGNEMRLLYGRKPNVWPPPMTDRQHTPPLTMLYTIAHRKQPEANYQGERNRRKRLGGRGAPVYGKRKTAHPKPLPEPPITNIGPCNCSILPNISTKKYDPSATGKSCETHLFPNILTIILSLKISQFTEPKNHNGTPHRDKPEDMMQLGNARRPGAQPRHLADKYQSPPAANCREEARARANTRRLGDFPELTASTTEACKNHMSLPTIPDKNLPTVPPPTNVHRQTEAPRERKPSNEMWSRDGARDARNGPPTDRQRAFPSQAAHSARTREKTDTHHPGKRDGWKRLRTGEATVSKCHP